jgi:hypothetical protein
MFVLVGAVILSLLLGVAVFLQLRHPRRDRGISPELHAARRAMRSAARNQQRSAPHPAAQGQDGGGGFDGGFGGGGDCGGDGC